MTLFFSVLGVIFATIDISTSKGKTSLVSLLLMIVSTGIITFTVVQEPCQTTQPSNQQTLIQ